MLTDELSSDAVVPVLTWVGDGAWIATDPTVLEGDRRRVIAYLEHSNHKVSVLWVRSRREVSSYPTLRDALSAVALACQGPLTTTAAPEAGMDAASISTVTTTLPGPNRV